MTVNSNLMKAILAMDAYNRGYGAGIDLRPRDSNGNLVLNPDGTIKQSDAAGTKLGNALVYASKGDTAAQTVGFYGIAYNYGGETVISYRGTDNPLGLNGDFINGWVIAAGATSFNQVQLAFQFYQSVANSAYFANGNWAAPQVAISLTGHSLGGGLAGLVGATYAKSGVLFDNMPFELAAHNVQVGNVIKSLVYGTSLPGPLDFTRLSTEYINGEALQTLRGLQTDTQVKPGYDLGNNVNLPDSLGVDEHSMS
ncbi:MAG: hypothetical protein WBK77_06800, partial [Alphaproteobacteria bacterium]